MGLLLGSEELDGLLLVVALAGVNSLDYTLSDCLMYLVMALAIVPILKGFWQPLRRCSKDLLLEQ